MFNVGVAAMTKVHDEDVWPTNVMIDNESTQIIGAVSESKERQKSDKKREMRKERAHAPIMCNNDAVAQRESIKKGLYILRIPWRHSGSTL